MSLKSMLDDGIGLIQKATPIHCSSCGILMQTPYQSKKIGERTVIIDGERKTVWITKRYCQNCAK